MINSLEGSGGFRVQGTLDILYREEPAPGAGWVWVVRVGGDDGELRPWHYTYVYSIESRLVMRVRYDSHIRIQIQAGDSLRASCERIDDQPPDGDIFKSIL